MARRLVAEEAQDVTPLHLLSEAAVLAEAEALPSSSVCRWQYSSQVSR